VEVAVDRKLHQPRDAFIHRLGKPLEHVGRCEGIPVLDPTATVFSLAAVLDPFSIEKAIDSALRLRLTHIGLLRERLGQYARQGRNGIRSMRALIEERDPATAPTGGDAEVLLMRIIKRFSLPQPVKQMVIRDGSGHFVARPDFVYPKQRLVIEAQSYAFHSDRLQWEKDQRRLNALVLLGWTILYFNYFQMVRYPEHVAVEIHQALQSFGRAKPDLLRPDALKTV
jgi:hypothetical protein